jgi:uncharacterized protein YycO
MRGDILACYGNDFLSRAIEQVTGSPISHIAVKISDNFIMETGWSGVKLSKISRLSNKYIILRDENFTEGQREQFVSFVINAVNIKFDYKLFFGIALNKMFGLNTNWDNKNKYICNELVVEAYKSLGINILSWIEDQNIVPGDLLNCNRFKHLKPDGTLL